jgi:nucleoside-diphosphate-sugar epimerase
MKKLRILVTGSNGFLGAHVVRQLLLRKHHVLAAHRASSDLWRLMTVRNSIELVEMDLLDRQSIENIFRKNRLDAVVNCAAYGVKYEENDLGKAFAVNVHGASDLLIAAQETGVSRFIHIGSCFEYGNKDHPICEDEMLEPTDIYGVSKASGALLAMALSRQKNVPLVVVRPFGLWGPLEEKHRLVPQVVSHCLAKAPLKLTGGEQIRDYLFVEDAALMLINLLELSKFPSYEILNLGSGIPVRLDEFIINVASFFNQADLMLLGELPYRPTEMMHLVANIKKWTKYVGEIRRTGISEGIQKILGSSSATKTQRHKGWI